MRRREFIALLSGAPALWPLATWAEQSAKVPTIGFLGTNASNWIPWTAAFVGRLRELGWVEDRTVGIEYRWSEGRPDRAAEIAAEFVRVNVDIIVTVGPAIATVKQATALIPIVFALANDAVGGGLVASLARPGGNATGLSFQSTDLAGKRLELLREVAPGLRRLAIMLDADFAEAALEVGQVEASARTLGIQVTQFEIRSVDDIAPAFEALKGHTDALYVVAGALVAANRKRIITFALGALLPTIFPNREFADVGGLMSYGANFPDLFRRAAELVDKILRGAKPGDIPVEQPTKFDLVVNLKTATALGLTIPDKMLALVDEVIE